ncbi:ribokinase [Halobacillus sp. MO56]
MKKPKITVIGSINMDLTTTTDRIPAQGETLHGLSFATYPGGKGFNQAVAAARSGADVSMVGAIGDDSFGQELSHMLMEEQINTVGVRSIKGLATGTATILLTEGDNRIIVVPGANGKVTAEQVEEQKETIAESDMVLLQLEIPMEAVERAAEIAYEAGVPIILNPAPAQPLSNQLLEKITYLTPNETEISEIVSDENIHRLQDKLIITKGELGVVFYQDGHTVNIPAYPVEAVDTTGAGDTFCGLLSTRLAQGDSLRDACNYANAGAALSVMKPGAQGGMPADSEVTQFLRDRGGGSGT